MFFFFEILIFFFKYILFFFIYQISLSNFFYFVKNSYNKLNFIYLFFMFIFICTFSWICSGNWFFTSFLLDFSNFFFFFDFIFYDFSIIFSFDIFSFFFLLLILFIFSCCFLFMLNSTKILIHFKKTYYLSLLFLFLSLFIVFLTSNLFIFYIFFELCMLSFFFFIGLNGSPSRKIHAFFLLLFFTLFGSVFFLFSLLFLFYISGSFDILFLQNIYIDPFIQKIIFIGFFISFCIKLPTIPFHSWLPEAHVESPTEASVILASIMLKIPIYGYFRFLLDLFPLACNYFSTFIYILCLFSLIYASLIALKELDMKRIIAYSSISHMNFCFLGLIFLNSISFAGILFFVFCHGIISSALFMLIGLIYEKTNTKNIYYYSGLIYSMPIFSLFFFIFILGNISFPFTGNFIGELLVSISLFEFFHFFSFFFIFFGIFFVSIYCIWFVIRILYGIPFLNVNHIEITMNNFFLLFFLLILILIFGIFSSNIFSFFFFIF